MKIRYDLNTLFLLVLLAAAGATRKMPPVPNIAYASSLTSGTAKVTTAKTSNTS